MKKSLLIASLFAFSAAHANAQDFAVTHATLADGSGGAPVENATIVVKAGKVVAAGPSVAVPAGIPTVDGRGKWVTPGLFASATSLGLYDVDAVDSSNDSSSDNEAFNASLDVSYALNPASQHIAVARSGGLTRASIVSSSSKSIFGGQGAVIDLGMDANIVTKPRAFQVVSLGEGATRITGGSRMASFAELDAAFRDAAEIAAGRREADEARVSRSDAAALTKVLSGEQALYIAAHRAADIRQILALKSRYPKINIVLLGAAEGWIVAREIAAANVPVITNPLMDLPDQFETLAATQSNVGRMIKAGVKVAIGTLDGGTNGQARSLAQFAGNLVALQKVPGASGLTWGQAFAAITSVPAQIAGFDGKLGVIKPGAAADIVLWDGDPLEVSSAPTTVYIDGVEQSLESHQSRLKQRYRSLDETVLPKGYDW